MNQDTDNARWQGTVDAQISELQRDYKELKAWLFRLLYFVGSVVIGMALLYLRSLGVPI